MKSTKTIASVQKRGEVCNKVLFSYFASVLHHVSVNHAFHSPTSTQQTPSSDICKDLFFLYIKESKNI